MLKKTISYTDFDGKARVEDHYFNLTKAELVEWQLRSVTPDNPDGGLTKELEAIVASNDGQQIMDRFRAILAMSYGVKSEDGRRFIKKPEYFEEFTQTEAFSEFFLELITDAGISSAFITGLVPPDLAHAASREVQARQPRQPQDHRPKQPQVIQPPDTQELMSVTGEPQDVQNVFDQKDVSQMTLPEQIAHEQAMHQTGLRRPLHESGPGFEKLPPEARPYPYDQV